MSNAGGKPMVAEGRAELHCSHCGRRVRETLHTRASYAVDYYELHTGQVEASILRRGDDGPVQVYQRLIVPELVITCAGCYRDPLIQEEREHRFQPELHQPGEAEEVSA